MNKSYSETPLYNITRYLQKCHEEKKEPDPILMNLVNFAEGGFLNYSFDTKNHGRVNVEIKETLAENCMNHLPFEAYEKYFNANWIDYVQEYGQNITLAAIYKRDIKLVEKIYSVGLEKALAEKDYAHSFIKDVLTPIMSIPENSRRNHHEEVEAKIGTDFGTKYLTIVKKVTADMKYLKERMWYPNKPIELKYTKNPNWIKDVDHGTYNRDTKEVQLYELLSSLVWNQNFSPLFVDAFNLLLKEHKDLEKMKSVLGIISEYNDGMNILGDAFMSGNKEIVELLVHSLKLTEQDCVLAYENKTLAYLSSLSNNSCGINTMIEKCFNKNYHDMKTSFFPNFDSKYLPFIMLGNDEELKKELLKNKDILNTPLVKDGSNLKYIIYLAKTIEAYAATTHTSKGKLSWKTSSSDKKTLEFLVAEHLIKEESPLLNDVDFKNAKIEDLVSLEKNMLDLHKHANLIIDRQTKSIDNENLSQWIKVFILDQSLSTTSQNRTKVKI